MSVKSTRMSQELRNKSAEYYQEWTILSVYDIPSDQKLLSDYKLLKILKRLFQRANDIKFPYRQDFGIVQIKYHRKEDADEDLKFATTFYGWNLVDGVHLQWKFCFSRKHLCDPTFPLLRDSFKISYLPVGVRRSTLRQIFPDVRSIAISKKRVRNKLIDCLKFNIAEAVLKFNDPLDANENYDHAKCLQLNGVPIRVMAENQKLHLHIQRFITVTNIPDDMTEDCLRETLFPQNYCDLDVNAVYIHKSPDNSVGPTARIWFPGYSQAEIAYQRSCLAKISPLWLDWIKPQEIKISDIDSKFRNKYILLATTAMLGRNIKISFQRKRKNIIVTFKTSKRAQEGFEYLTKSLKWVIRSDRNVIADYLPEQQMPDGNWISKEEAFQNFDE